MPDVELFADAPLKYVVFDEAHTYTGASGAEVACLIRRLRAYCGRGSSLGNWTDYLPDSKARSSDNAT